MCVRVCVGGGGGGGAVIIQHAKRMLHVILIFVACLAVPYFSKLSHKRHDFRKKIIKHRMCVLTFCRTLPQTFLVLIRIQRDINISVYLSSCKVPVILVRF
jgi:hypothetical protein